MYKYFDADAMSDTPVWFTVLYFPDCGQAPPGGEPAGPLHAWLKLLALMIHVCYYFGFHLSFAFQADILCCYYQGTFKPQEEGQTGYVSEPACIRDAKSAFEYLSVEHSIPVDRIIV